MIPTTPPAVPATIDVPVVFTAVARIPKPADGKDGIDNTAAMQAQIDALVARVEALESKVATLAATVVFP